MSVHRSLLSAPFSVYGGKKYLAAKIVPMIPAHTTYVEPFAGAASVLFSKPRSPEEVLGDIDVDKVRALTFIRDHSDVDRQRLLGKSWDRSKKTFLRLQKSQPTNPVDWMYRQLYLRWNSFGCRGDSWAYNNAAAGWSFYLRCRLPAYRERLKGVSIREASWTQTVFENDTPETFFYLDPPYIGTANKDAVHFNEVSAQDLLAVLSRLKGKWLMSNSAHPSLATAFRNYRTVTIDVPTQIDQMHGSALRTRTEYLIGNYEFGA